MVWRGTTNATTGATKLTDASGTNYDDTAVTAGTTYYYWVKAVNVAGASSFSASDSGFIGVVGPLITANGLVGDVYLNIGDTVTIAVQMMNIEPYIGVEVDWWVVARVNSSWYYLNSAMQWTQFDGDLSNCHPVYQGGLGNVPATKVLNTTGLSVGSYTFWFAVDYPMDGILNADGQILVDSVNVTVLLALPAPCVKANGAKGTVTVNYPKTVSVTVEMNAGSYVGVPADWWVFALAGSSWYYLNNSVQWTEFDWNLLNYHPVYQGGLFNLPATKVFNYGLGAGSYTFYFAVDYPMDGILNVEQMWLDSVKVNVQ